MSEVKNNVMQSKEYDSFLDVVNRAVPDIETIAHLIECVTNYTYEVGLNKEQDGMTAMYLANSLRDIAKGIEDCFDKQKIQKQS
ncbi:MAG: hypothetical protein ACK5LP_00915 [Campylobacteraceae bacterium]